MRTVFIVFFLLPLMLASCVFRSPDSTASDAYDFPVKPGTKEWAAFTTHEEMVDACQIPESILHNIDDFLECAHFIH